MKALENGAPSWMKYVKVQIFADADDEIIGYLLMIVVIIQRKLFRKSDEATLTGVIVSKIARVNISQIYPRGSSINLLGSLMS